MSKTATLILRVDAGFKERLVKAAGKRGMTAYVVSAVEAKMATVRERCTQAVREAYAEYYGDRPSTEGRIPLGDQVREVGPTNPILSRPTKEGHRAVYRFGKFDHWEKI